ncbi:MAG: heavy metal-binding domain-containing protein [Arcticibacter sp.]
MNTLKNLGLAVFLMTAAACGNGSESNTEETPTATNVKDTVNAYVCPMRCENSGSSQAGACPVCAMDLVQNTDFVGSSTNNVEGEVSGTGDSTATNADSALTKTE